MKVIHLFISVTIAILITYFGNKSIQIGETTLPPIISFLNPYTGFWTNAEPLTTLNQQFQSKHIDKNIDIIYNDRDVPFIFAHNENDLFYAQGYTHARHRLWQMEMMTRAASGQLSEILGANLLEYDKNQRRIGMLYASEQALESVKNHAQTYSYITSYIQGINDYVSELDPKDYPIEYKLMNFSPKKFTPLDVMIVYKLMTYDLAFRHNDLESTLTKQVLGDSIFNILFPRQIDESVPIIPNQDFWDEIASPKIIDSFNIPLLEVNNDELIELLSSIASRKPDESNGSNNWAVSAEKSVYNNPILANDPHLTLRLPSIWHETQLKSNEIHAYGVSIPCIPGVILGFNNQTAWGSTNVGQDVGDWYKLNWIDSDLKHYILDGEKHQVILRKEIIKVRDSENTIIEIPITKAGIIPYTDKENPLYGLAFHWLGHERNPNDEFSTFINLNKGNNLSDYIDAINEYNAPAQNLVFASTDGDIALSAQGKYPIRQQLSARFITEVDSSNDLWIDYISETQVPRSINPASHYVSSANQKTTTDAYPYYYEGNFEEYRHIVLDSLLRNKGKLDIEDFKEIQLNNFNLGAKEFIETIMKYIDKTKLNSQELAFIESFEDWNYTYDKDSENAVKCEMWIDEIYELLFDEWEIDTAHNVLLYPPISRMIELMREKPDFIIWDHQNSPNVRESVSDVIYGANQHFETSITATIKKYEEWEESRSGDVGAWANYKGTKINHMANIPAFSSSILNSGGHANALNAQKSNFGPSWRMIVSLGDTIEAYGIFPGGQSGNPGSKFYDNNINPYVSGEYHKLELYQEPIEVKNVQYKIELKNEE